jgi:hypothetical protein
VKFLVTLSSSILLLLPFLSTRFSHILSCVNSFVGDKVSDHHETNVKMIVFAYFNVRCIERDRLCGLVVRVFGYRSGGPGSIPGTTKKKSSGSGMGSTQPREYN